MKFIFRILLTPLGIFYLLATVIRNKLFDYGILRSERFSVPIISIGNLSMGGTGKTPHTEYLAQLIENKEQPIAILSRGYKRKTKGFVLATDQHTYEDIGDEPLQYKLKFNNSNIIVAVDSNRRRGIRKLMELYPDLKAILLDDAYQHRYVKAGLNILLSDYYSPFFKDRILPFGNLREKRSGKKRADVVVVTKSPSVISPITRRDITSKCKLHSHQHLVFSRIQYDQITSMKDNSRIPERTTFSTIFLFSGISNPYPLEQHLKSYCIHLEKTRFPDHHGYSIHDIKKILYNFEAHLSTNKIIVTTEKDIMRLQTPGIMELLSNYPVFFIPVRVEFDKNDKETMHKIITDYVSKNQRNS